MGAGSSKPNASSTGSKHVFSSSSPIQFSSNLIDALQSSGETDSSRAKSVELQIQARVAEELARIQEREQQTLAEIRKRLSEVKDNDDASAVPVTASANANAVPSTPDPAQTYYPMGSLNLDAPRVPFAGREYAPVTAPATAPAPAAAAAPAAADRPARAMSSESVNSEIQALRSRLEGRKKLIPLDEKVESAKEGVISCLRLNDRRPLDCWKEVQEFKNQVARLEEAFIDRIVG